MRDRLSIGPAGGTPAAGAPQPPRPRAPAPAAGGFAETLAGAVGAPTPVRLSAHAEDRLRQSGRQLSAAELARLAGALDRAAEKGARETLVLLPDLALVVGVRSRTVITAVAGPRRKENIFTNIDSAVILD